MTMNNNKIKRDVGLPTIASNEKHRKPIILGMIGLISVVFLSVRFFTKDEIKPDQTIQETYSVATEKPIEIVNQKPVLPPVVLGSQVSQDVSPKKEFTEQQVAIIQEKEKELQQRLSAPLIIVNSSSISNPPDVTVNKPIPSNDRNTQFLNQVSSQATDVANASSIGDLNVIVAEGSLIHAILEPATNSDLPGYLRATVSEPNYSENGRQILIPKGSRLIGQYKSGMQQGQSRIYIVWTRLITPEGFSINLGSPGVDSIGMAGISADVIDRHFWERFGTGSLLSMLGIGTANVGMSGVGQDNPASAYRNAIANSFSQSANDSLSQDIKVAPTLKTYQGKPIIVFVARDLNFQAAIKSATPRLNVF